LEVVQRSSGLFFFTKAIMYLANVLELNDRIGRAWEIACCGLAETSSEGDCAAGMSGTMRRFVGEGS
jgi:hypothetical protein